MTLIIAKPAGAKLVFKKDPVLADRYYNDTVLLIHGDGTNGSTTITDSSLSLISSQVFGDAKISTAQSKFGGSSIEFDGTGDYVSFAASTNYIMNGDFTIECWIYPKAQANYVILDQYISGTAGAGNWQIYLTSGGNTQFYYDGTFYITYSGYPTVNSWSHYAAVRSSGTIKQYLNGTAVGNSINFSGQVGRNSSLWLGAQHDSGPSLYLNGYLDEIRITKAARYTANFTPPTAPFPEVVG